LKITIPISVGELLDKISILSIKSQYTTSEYVKKELKDLIDIAKKYRVYNESYISELNFINNKLWKIEDDLRVLEKSQDFGKSFIELARKVYITNDLRSSIKNEINKNYDSYYREIKVHK